MDQRDDRPKCELPFEAQPDIDRNRHQRRQDRIDRRPDQLGRDLRADRFDRREGDRRIDLFQRALDRLDGLRRDRFRAALGADADLGHVLIRTEAGIIDLGDGHVAQIQRLQGLAIDPHIDRLSRFGADRGAALEVYAEIQPEDQQRHDRQQRQGRRDAEGQHLPAEKVDLRLVRNQFQTESHVTPRSGGGGRVRTRRRSSAG